jgi:hypothetical protein
MPKTPRELREQVERAQEQESAPGRERTAEGEEVETPNRRDFFENLEKVSRPDEPSRS